MGLTRGFEVKVALLLGLAALFSFGANGASESLGARRGLADAAATVFDVTNDGANPESDGSTDSALLD
ncbi:unnamed protein product [Ilex paraguariensis]|uniref:Secreted protein n=1 Tax=Ilex paraguariensis TaxID=185542 RepID=A0ABC8U1A2_9AQUA